MCQTSKKTYINVLPVDIGHLIRSTPVDVDLVRLTPVDVDLIRLTLADVDLIRLTYVNVDLIRLTPVDEILFVSPDVTLCVNWAQSTN